MSQAQVAIANYSATSALAVLARQQVLDSIERIGAILDGVSGDGARLFPQFFSDGSVYSATDLLDLVEHADFSTEQSALELLTTRFGPSIFQAIFKEAFAEERSMQDDPRIQSVVTPPAKRARRSTARPPVASSSKLVPASFPLPEPLSTRTISQGEASSSSRVSSRGRSRQASGTRKRKTRT